MEIKRSVVLLAIVVVILFGFFLAIVISDFNSGTAFRLKREYKSPLGDVPIFKYESDATGLHLTIAQMEGPIVHGIFTVVTEAYDDTGLPNSLEHLVLMGSKDYPYNGALREMAIRGMSERMTSKTETDHTLYTVQTAGTDGILNLLPVYLDHLLFPLLTNFSFMTEIHHITGEGNDAGTMYAEVEESEKTGLQLVHDAYLKALYPEPSGYRYNAIGTTANIRNLTIDMVKDYHKAKYQAQNIHIFLIGQVDSEEVFRVLQSVEDKIFYELKGEPYVKPWQTPITPIGVSKQVEVYYPSDTEYEGIVRVGWRGPSVTKNVTELQAVAVLLKYLKERLVSPMSAVLNGEESGIEISMSLFAISSCEITFIGIPKNKINEVKPQLTRTMNKIALNISSFNLEEFRNALKNQIVDKENAFETLPNSILSAQFIQDAVNGQTYEYLDELLNEKSVYEHLLTQPTSYWLNLLKKYFVSSPSVTVKGIPSLAKANQVRAEKIQRVEDNKKELGTKGLIECEQKLADAKDYNAIPPPREMVESVPIASPDCIPFHCSDVYTNIENSYHIINFLATTTIENSNGGSVSSIDTSQFDLSFVPVKMQLDDVKSNFVQITAILDTQSLSASERLYLPLLTKLLLKSPIRKGTKEIPYEEVIKSLSENTIIAGYTTGGVSMSNNVFEIASYFNNVALQFKTEMSKYKKGVELLSDILFRVIFNAERVSVTAAGILNSIEAYKGQGDVMIGMMFDDLACKNDTNVNKLNIFRQEKFLNQMISTMKNPPSKILRDLLDVYKTITDLDNMTIHMATNLGKLTSTCNASAPWLNFTANGKKSTNMKMNDVLNWKEQRALFPSNQSVTGYIAMMSTVRVSSLVQTAPCITDHSDADLPALLVASAFLVVKNGPMWNKLEGNGRAQIKIDPILGVSKFEIHNAPKVAEAYKRAIEVINSYSTLSVVWDRRSFESMRSSLISLIAYRELAISDVVQQSLLAHFKKVTHDYNRILIDAIGKVKLTDMPRIAQKYFRAMVDPQQSRTAIVCNMYEAIEIKTQMNKLGHDLEVLSSLENSRFGEL